ncbi:hypothetical protein K7X08_005544 [Anisodus acutangulus]|uniref:RRM domain-containing protein n=1 Tax=Anisodus acutangulus TaxID=402998 RepID=A0A9Q1R7C0_9SOLA|nr:hypothetical protein K7X08_005544 [Anisodus acutangulus]
MFLLKCLHYLNAIELWLNVHLNKKNEQEMSLQKINQPLSHDQLNKIAKGISVLLPGVLENVLSETKTTSHEGFIHRKLLVGSLGIHTNSETLHRIFSAYGEIQEAFVVKDKSGVSKEYGFVIFKNGPFGFDKETRKSRGYAIFVYKTLEGAKTAIYEPKCVDGHYLTCEMTIPRAKKKPCVGPNLNCNYGTSFYDRYENERSKFDGCGSRSEVSQVGVQYAPCQGNGKMYAQKCDCGLVSNGNIHVGLSSPVTGLNHMGSGLCSNMGHADFSFWSSDFPSSKTLLRIHQKMTGSLFLAVDS